MHERPPESVDAKKQDQKPQNAQNSQNSTVQQPLGSPEHVDLTASLERPSVNLETGQAALHTSQSLADGDYEQIQREVEKISNQVKKAQGDASASLARSVALGASGVSGMSTISAIPRETGAKTVEASNVFGRSQTFYQQRASSAERDDFAAHMARLKSEAQYIQDQLSALSAASGVEGAKSTSMPSVVSGPEGAG